MKYQNKVRIIEILQEYGRMIGNSSEEIEELVNEVRVIATYKMDSSTDKAIRNQMNKFCALLDYEPTPENNRIRLTDNVARRDAVARLIFDQFIEDYPRAVVVVGEFFGKDRTTGISMNKRSMNRMNTNDKIFKYYYEKLVVSYNLEAA